MLKKKFLHQRVEISYRTIVFTVVFLISLVFLYYIRDIILEFFVALLIAIILDPFVSRLSRYKIPRAVSVLMAYLIVFVVVAFVSASIVPPLVEQTAAFANNLPRYLESIGGSIFFGEQVVSEILSRLGALPEQIVKFGVSIFSNALAVLTVLMFAFYLLMARERIDRYLAVIFGEQKKEEIVRFISLLETGLGGWVRGQLTLMSLIGLLTYVGLRILGIPFALPLAVLAGLLEVVPYVGPIIAAIPLAIIGFGMSTFMGFATIALAFLIQQLENYVFVPKVMERSVGVDPVIILLALAIGLRIAGVVGIFIAIPVIIIIQIVAREYLFASSKKPPALQGEESKSD
jgi:predicted PurR-regulated permease PerM